MVQNLIRYRYWILFGAFVLWMTFFDSNNLFYRLQISRDIASLEKMKRIHLSSLEDLNRQREELKSSDRSLEKFAREKYRMKRDNEDIFVIVIDSTEKKDWEIFSINHG